MGKRIRVGEEEREGRRKEEKRSEAKRSEVKKRMKSRGQVNECNVDVHNNKHNENNEVVIDLIHHHLNVKK